MPRKFARLTIAAAIGASLLAQPAARAQSFTEEQRGEIGRIVKDFLLKNPEVLQEAVAELEKRQQMADSEKAKAAIAGYAEAIFNSPRHVVVGNPKGDVTLVEFFDYNCGYCKRALSDLLDVMKADNKVRVVLKEFPVLGPASIEAAQVSIAVRMQDKTGKKYMDFHQKLLGTRGQIDRARALAVAKEVGLDMARIERDLASDEIKQTLEESFQIAQALGLNGTPSYVVGSDLVIGAVGAQALREKVNAARCGKAVC